MRHGDHGVQAVETRGPPGLKHEIRPQARVGRGELAARLDLKLLQSLGQFFKIRIRAQSRIKMQGRRIFSAGRGLIALVPDVGAFAGGGNEQAVEAGLRQNIRQAAPAGQRPEEGLTGADGIRIERQPVGRGLQQDAQPPGRAAVAPDELRA